jgi:hypothetical protein
MKVVHDKIDRKNKGKNKNYGEMPEKSEPGLNKTGKSALEKHGKTQERCRQTKEQVFIRKIKTIFENKIKKEMGWSAKKPGCKSIET